MTSMVQLNKVGYEAMLEVGVNSVTDVTGFGLAGHAIEMADASRVTFHIRLSQLPLFPGVEQIARRPFLTRASHTNAGYVEAGLRKEPNLDPKRLEICFDAQTSGGLLISVSADKTDLLVEKAREKGAAFTCVIGEVTEKEGVSLVFEE